MIADLLHPLTGAPLVPLGVRDDGRVIWPILGGAPDGDGEGGDGDGSGDGGDGGSGAAGGRTFDQDAVNRIATRERNEGSRHGQRELAKSLGFTKADGSGDVDAMKAAAQAHRDQQRNAMSDADRAKQEADDLKAQAAQDRATAARERHEASVERALHRADVADNLLDDALRLIKVDEGADAETIRTAVADLKTRIPGLFVAGGGQQQQGSDPGRGPSGGRNGSGGGKPFGQAGRDRAARDFAAAS